MSKHLGTADTESNLRSMCQIKLSLVNFKTKVNAKIGHHDIERMSEEMVNKLALHSAMIVQYSLSTLYNYKQVPS